MKNQYKVTKKLLREWLTENMYKGFQLGLNIGWAALGIFSIFLMIFSCEDTADYVLFGVIIALCVYMCWLRIFPVTSVQYRRMAKIYGEENWVRTIDFGEDCITLSEGTISAAYAYKDIMSIREKGSRIWLTARNRTVLRLYKEAFIGGTWEECKALLISKREDLC